jgi:hypothetical protein
MGTPPSLIQRNVVAAPHLAAHIWPMRMLAFALLISIAGYGAALAACPSLPDEADTGYTANQTALTVCRQRELADAVRDQQFQQQINAQFRQLEMQMRLNEQLNRARQTLPIVPITPSF